MESGSDSMVYGEKSIYYYRKNRTITVKLYSSLIRVC
jgi:hypothetical protein